MEIRRHFTREYKLSVITELELGKSITQIAREHGIHPSMPSRWRVEFNENSDAAFRGSEKRHRENIELPGQTKVLSQIYNRILVAISKNANLKGGRQ